MKAQPTGSAHNVRRSSKVTTLNLLATLANLLKKNFASKNRGGEVMEFEELLRKFAPPLTNAQIEEIVAEHKKQIEAATKKRKKLLPF
jgi:hypothetical protein